MTLDELKDKWKIDCEIDTDDVGNAAVKAPVLHSFYLNELIAFKLRLVKHQNDMINYRVKRAKYYRGEMTKAELDENGWAQWQYKTLKSDIDNLIESDSEYQLLVTREAYMKTVIYFLESVMQEIKSRSFHVKNLIEWNKFRLGA